MLSNAPLNGFMNNQVFFFGVSSSLLNTVGPACFHFVTDVTQYVGVSQVVLLNNHLKCHVIIESLFYFPHNFLLYIIAITWTTTVLCMEKE